MPTSIKNSVQLIGNIGNALEITSFESGSKKLSISLATNDYYTNSKGEKTKQTEWHNLVAWGKTAENMAQSLEKGSEIAIQGKLSNRSYTDKAGATKYITEVIISDYFQIAKSNKPEASMA